MSQHPAGTFTADCGWVRLWLDTLGKFRLYWSLWAGCGGMACRGGTAGPCGGLMFLHAARLLGWLRCRNMHGCLTWGGRESFIILTWSADVRQALFEVGPMLAVAVCKGGLGSCSACFPIAWMIWVEAAPLCLISSWPKCRLLSPRTGRWWFSWFFAELMVLKVCFVIPKSMLVRSNT